MLATHPWLRIKSNYKLVTVFFMSSDAFVLLCACVHIVNNSVVFSRGSFSIALSIAIN